MAERTGLEPATTGVTGRYSNQLNYRSTYLRYINLGANKNDFYALGGRHNTQPNAECQQPIEEI